MARKSTATIQLIEKTPAGLPIPSTLVPTFYKRSGRPQASQPSLEQTCIM